MPYIGELAGLGTALMWSFGSLLFAEAGRRAGAFAVNQFRLTLSLVFLVVILWVTGLLRTMPDPGSPGVAWLAASGLIGLTVGDLCYFSALVRIGPRLSALTGALTPPITALVAYRFLGESLGMLAFGGMTLTLVGVVWVVLERPSRPAPRGHRIQGVLLGAAAAACQGIGLVIAKRGMGETIDPLQANAIRMAAATVGIWLIAGFTSRLSSPRRIFRDRTARLCAVGATIIGPTIGVWLSLVSARHTDAGIAATLMSLVPIVILPLVIFVQKEKVSPRAAFGAFIAVAGVALIFLRP